jgi:hypothetical protein
MASSLDEMQGGSRVTNRLRFRVLAVALLVLPTALASASPQPAAPATPTTLVYYFHATSRCGTCRTIEAYVHETVTSQFAPDLQARRLEWRAVNIEEPPNRHFIRDFQLYTRSVVVVDAKDPKRFKVLGRVWQLVSDKAAFQSYVAQEIRAFRRS